jgi:iron complex transport system ATP-binding protein
VARSTPLVAFSDASVVLGRTRALDRVTLALSTGEHVAIIGPNGSGKSTLVRTIAGDCRVFADGVGSVRVLGQDRWSLFDVRRHLGVVSDDLQAVCDRPVTAESIVLGGFFGSIGTYPHQAIAADMRASAVAALDRIGMRAFARRRMDTLSTGEARRVLIARALVHRPGTLIMDEPYDGLDPEGRYHFRALLRELAAEGTGLVLVTHDIGDIPPEVGRVVALRSGRVLFDLPKAEALTDARLSELFGFPAEVTGRDGFYHLW